MLPQVAQELRAGLSLLQKPYSDLVSVEVNACLYRAWPHARGMEQQPKQLLKVPNHRALLCEVLEMLTKYLQWFFPGISQYRKGRPTATVMWQDNGVKIISRPPSENQKTHIEGPCHEGGMLMYGLLLKYTLIAIETAGRGAVAAARPHLLAPGTGTLSALAVATDLLLPAWSRGQDHGEGSQSLGYCLCDAWVTISDMYDYGLSSSSSSSSISSMEGHQLLNLQQGLPAMAGLIHWLMQQPGQEMKPSVYGVDTVMEQLQQYLQQMATAARNAPPNSGAAGMQQQQQQEAERSPGPTSHAFGLQSVDQSMAHHQPLLAAGAWSQESRAQVERFLWRALATATAVLHTSATTTVRSTSRITASSGSATTTSCRSGATASSSSSSSNRHCVWSPASAGYTHVQPGKDEALVMTYRAAGALLQLAVADVAPAWSQQITPSMAAARPPPTTRTAGAPGASSFMPGHSGAHTSHGPFTRISAGGVGLSSSTAMAVLRLLRYQQPASQLTCGEPPKQQQQPQQQQLAALHFLQWPATLEATHGVVGDGHTSVGNRSSTAASASGAFLRTPTTIARGLPALSRTTPQPASSSSSNTGPDSAEVRLRLLAAAIDPAWRRIAAGGPPTQKVVLQSSRGTFTLMMQLLLLLVQQLQAGPCTLRTWFLGSPAGSTVLQVLHGMSHISGPVAEVTVVSAQAVAAAAGAADSLPAEAGMQVYAMSCRPLVKLLLLPGLLLQPAATVGAATGGPSMMPPCLGGAGALAPLQLAPRDALQLPPGCTPPPVAFFLVEQLLRGASSPAAFDMAVKLLAGSGGVLKPASGEQRHVQGEAASLEEVSEAGTGQTQAAAAELQRLAYCSLASSVVQAAAHQSQLVAAYAEQLWALVGELVKKASAEQDSNSSKWSCAASLAAATAAGAYTAHLRAAGITRLAAGGVGTQAGSSSRSADAACTTIITTTVSSTSSHSDMGGGKAAGPACGAAYGGFTQGTDCPVDCSTCCSAYQAFCDLRCLELGVALSKPTLAKPGGAAALTEAAKQCGTTLQQHLKRQLLALAWRHPVPGVCGNVLCGRLEGPSAMGAVRGRVGTLCGGCRAVRYCCEGCQRAAWAEHKAVCRASR